MSAFYTPQELAERWKVSAKTVLRMAESGDIASIKVGKKTRIPAHALSTIEGDISCQTITNLNAGRAGMYGTSTGLKTAGNSGQALAKQMRKLRQSS
jgi:excisionase family DNA binding protein